MKQKLLFLLAVLFSSISASAYDFYVGGIYYNREGTNAKVTFRDAYYNSYSGNIVIPEKVTYNGTTYSVTSINGHAFKGCTGLTSVTIPNSVTSIGDSAFYGCTGLTSVTIPNSVTEIGTSAFFGCTGLTSVNIPESVITLGNSAFSGCYNLTSVTIPNSVTIIRPQAFKGCTGLTSVTIPNSVATIGMSAFSGCTGLTSVTIPNSVTSIGDSAFSGCTGLTSVTIPNSVTTIGYYAFNGCTGLTSVTIPSSVTEIAKDAFLDCTGLTRVDISDLEAWCRIKFSSSDSNPLYRARILYLNGEEVKDLVIPNSVTEIGEYAFKGCYNLTSVTIPESVTSIGDMAFYYCTCLNSVTIPSSVTEIGKDAFNNCDYLYTLNTDMEFLLNFENISSILNRVKYINIDGKPLSSFEIPDDVTSFSNLPFLSRCSTLKSINTGNGITAFPTTGIGLGNVNSVTLGSSMTSLGGASFPNATIVMSHANSAPTITSNTFPKCAFGGEGVVIVDSPAAQDAYSAAAVWEDLQISNLDNVAEVTVTTPGDLSFDLITQCGMAVAKVVGLKVHGVLNNDDFQQMKVNMKALMNIDLTDTEMTSVPANAFAGKISLTSIKLPSNCANIGDNAFKGCINLSDVVINNSCASIGDNAFEGCSALTDISIPESVTTINQSAFANSALKSVTLSNGLTSIGDNAFQNTFLINVTLPNSLKTLGNYAFSGSEMSNIEFGRSLTTIGDYAFKGCKLTQQLTLPEDLVNIGDGAFEGQDGITGHVTLYDKVSVVGERAFAGTSISSVFLSNKMTGINASTFAGCQNLDIVYLPDNIGYLGESAFDGCSSLTQLRIPSTLDEIGAKALRATAINSVKVPDPVTEINEATFAQCLSLRSVSLPEGITTLEAESFNGCKALRNLSVKAVEPPTVMGASVFKGVNTDLCVLSIPTASYRAYVLADYWGQFIQMRNDIIVEVEGNGEINFDAVEETENESPAEVRRRAVAMAAQRRAEAVATAENGSTLYIPKNGTVNFYITPAEGEIIVSATFDGRDILGEINNGVFTTTADKKSGKLVVRFSGKSNSIDVNAAEINGEAIYYNLQGVRVDHPAAGIYIVGGKKVVVN